MFKTLTCKNYKAHIGPYTWHLGGVSILQNSNGKSSLLRLLPLLRGRDGGVLCIENPEIALNHKRQRALATYLMRLPVHNHAAQLIIETSAPGFIEVATEMQANVK